MAGTRQDGEETVKRQGRGETTKREGEAMGQPGRKYLRVYSPGINSALEHLAGGCQPNGFTVVSPASDFDYDVALSRRRKRRGPMHHLASITMDAIETLYDAVGPRISTKKERDVRIQV
jgi:hypothetical protein